MLTSVLARGFGGCIGEVARPKMHSILVRQNLLDFAVSSYPSSRSSTQVS